MKKDNFHEIVAERPGAAKIVTVAPARAKVDPVLFKRLHELVRHRNPHLCSQSNGDPRGDNHTERRSSGPATITVKPTAGMDAGLEHLKTLKALEVLFLIGTKVSDQGVEKLKSCFGTAVVMSHR